MFTTFASKIELLQLTCAALVISAYVYGIHLEVLSITQH